MTKASTVEIQVSDRDYDRLSGLALLLQTTVADVADRLLHIALEQIAKGALRIDGGM